MFQGLRWRLLIYYLTVIASILSVFVAGVYVFFGRTLYRQLDKKLLTLAQSAASSFSSVENQGESYLTNVDKVPWRDIFNRDKQSLEWFNADGDLLGSKGFFQLEIPPQPGALNGVVNFYPDQDSPEESTQVSIRAYTISVFKDSNVPDNPATLEGYIRASQSIEEIDAVQNRLFLVLIGGAGVTLILSGLGGIWLTHEAISPIRTSFLKLKQFTADASHELRGPLTAIKASVDIMKTHPERVHPKDAKKIMAISSATDQMGQLIEDLLFLARTDKKVVLPTREKKSVSLESILQNIVILLEPCAQEKKITLTSKLDSGFFVLGDISQLTRLFSNLLQNALQYTPEGGNVTLELLKQNRSAIITIKDTGIGISTEQLPYIFDRFWRADKARSRREGGTGLGLSIVKAIAENHGGKISVTSNVNVGSCFQVRLPLLNYSGAKIISNKVTSKL
ncbi:histidine kinase [Xenococcus sp. PCC 7305]|uniref:sensor histidine kinase n=1 Tax=Xenococcus sp. PCC 7305 TaxID=102125 RepID=UPI0002AC9708|nr:HAMP domain-containing sensor histidine kinase [Xenococcus sp. PCC 7305]ELS00671.1 histidine kinase [Xenococcus sp. PCC 7305]